MTTGYGNNRNGNVFLWLLAAIVLGVCMLAMTGCKCPCAGIGTDVSTTDIDSTDIKVRDRDVTITTPADSASIKALLRCDSAYNVVIDELAILQGERMKSQANAKHTDNGGLEISLNCKEDSLQNVIHAKDSIINRMRTHKEVVKETITVEVESNPFLYKSGIALWVLIALFVVSVIIGIILKFAK